MVNNKNQKIGGNPNPVRGTPFTGFDRYNRMKTRIYVPYSARSGLGDRMLDLLAYATYGATRNADVYIQWRPYIVKAQDPPWRALDTSLSNVLSFFKLPSWIHLVEQPPPLPYEEWSDHLGGVVSPTTFCKDLGLPFIDVRAFFTLNVPFYVPPTDYTVVHLRRTDKLNGVDKWMIPANELGCLDELTRDAVRMHGHSTIYVASDDLDARRIYETWLEECGYTVLRPTNPHSLLPSYFDLWMMWSASNIIVSMKYTTFSLFPALFRDIPIFPVLGTEQYASFEPIVRYVDTKTRSNT